MGLEGAANDQGVRRGKARPAPGKGCGPRSMSNPARVARRPGTGPGPGGAVLICHMSYLALPGNVCSATEALVLETHPAPGLGGLTDICPAWTVGAAVAG